MGKSSKMYLNDFELELFVSFLKSQSITDRKFAAIVGLHRNSVSRVFSQVRQNRERKRSLKRKYAESLISYLEILAAKNHHHIAGRYDRLRTELCVFKT